MSTADEGKVIQATGTIYDVLSRLRAVTEQDNLAEQKLKGLRGRRTGMIVGLVVSIFVSFFLIALTAGLALIVFLPLWVALVIGIIVYSTRISREAKMDFDDRKIELVRTFLEVMAQDIPRKATCSIAINDDGYLKHGQLVEKEGGMFATVRSTQYADEWGLVSGRLHDGTAFKVAIEEDVKRKEKPKRKYTKVNERISEGVSVALRLDPQVYPNAQQAAAGLAGSAVPDGCTIQRAEVTDNVLRVKATLGELRRLKGRYGAQESAETAATGARLLGLFAFIYGHLAQARPAATSTPTEPTATPPGPEPSPGPA